jgi:hypothetical protein
MILILQKFGLVALVLFVFQVRMIYLRQLKCRLD